VRLSAIAGGDVIFEGAGRNGGLEVVGQVDQD
jgi:hypothetical protein